MKNIIHTKPIKCPKCKTRCIYNGYSNEGNYNFLAKNNNIFFKKGQQYCPNCNKTYQIEIEEFDEINEIIFDKIKNQIYSLLEFGNSDSQIQLHLKRIENIKISTSEIKLIRKDFFNKIEHSFPELDILENSDLQGFYGYDEQYTKVDGIRYLRVVLLNLDTNEIIYEELIRKLSSVDLENILRNLFKENIPRGFVFDMKTMYPKVFQNVFGKNIKIQFCIFHLNKSIMDKFNKKMKFLGKDFWTLEEVHKMYSIFNIFYDRTIELSYLTELIFQRDFAYFFSNSLDKKFFDKLLRKQFRKNCHDSKLIRERRNGSKTLKKKLKKML